MRILVLGLPGSGKSTQVDRLAEHLGVPTVKMGAILREIAEGDSELGKKIKVLMNQGHLVNDEIVEEIIRKTCEKFKDHAGFVMEGYPRTVHQINNFDPKFDQVFYLEIDRKLAKQRMLERARADDNVEAMENRFHEQMRDLDKILEHYHAILIKVDATRGIEEIFEELVDNLPKRK